MPFNAFETPLSGLAAIPTTFALNEASGRAAIGATKPPANLSPIVDLLFSFLFSKGFLISFLKTLINIKLINAKIDVIKNNRKLLKVLINTFVKSSPPYLPIYLFKSTFFAIAAAIGLEIPKAINHPPIRNTPTNIKTTGPFVKPVTNAKIKVKQNTAI